MIPRMYALPEELTGNDIKDIRKTLHLTQAEFSHLVHVSKKGGTLGNRRKGNIDVDERARQVAVYNFTAKPMFQAFGRAGQPDFAQYEEFLESRCFPRSRDKLKLKLKELDLPFYDPLMIIEKTEGRMAEDDFWIRIER